MSTYAIGDVQGCFLSFQKLLDKIRFNPKKDFLYLLGDIVNRGPRSLEVLKWCLKNRKNIQIVLGNHDIYFLNAAANGPRRKDTLTKVLKSSEIKKMISWLKTQKFLIKHGNYILVHAGIHPNWSLKKAEELAVKLEKKIQSPQWKKLLTNHFKKVNVSEFDYNLNIFTRIRMLDKNLKPVFNYKYHPKTAPKNYKPWYVYYKNKKMILFGHWAGLGFTKGKNYMCLDAGCSWGDELIAFRFDDKKIFRQKGID